jgi:hypothetical protein
MIGYKITIQQKNELAGAEMPDGIFFNPVQDINGDWFIFEKEFEASGFGVLTDFIPLLPPEII